MPDNDITNLVISPEAMELIQTVKAIIEKQIPAGYKSVLVPIVDEAVQEAPEIVKIFRLGTPIKTVLRSAFCTKTGLSLLVGLIAPTLATFFPEIPGTKISAVCVALAGIFLRAAIEDIKTITGGR